VEYISKLTVDFHSDECRVAVVRQNKFGVLTDHKHVYRFDIQHSCKLTVANMVTALLF